MTSKLKCCFYGFGRFLILRIYIQPGIFFFCFYVSNEIWILPSQQIEFANSVQNVWFRKENWRIVRKKCSWDKLMTLTIKRCRHLSTQWKEEPSSIRFLKERKNIHTNCIIPLQYEYIWIKLGDWIFSIVNYISWHPIDACITEIVSERCF